MGRCPAMSLSATLPTGYPSLSSGSSATEILIQKKSRMYFENEEIMTLKMPHMADMSSLVHYSGP